MQVSVTSTGTLERQLSVEIPEERIASRVATRIGELAKTTRIDGFRPGKVPRKVIEKRFGPRVRQEIVGEVLQTSFQEALQSESLRPAGEPSIDPLEAEVGHGLRYTATFEVYPEVDLAKADGLQLEKPVCEIQDADLDAMIEKLREQRKEWQAVERAAEEGDRVVIDFTGYVDEEAFEGGSAEDFPLELGSGQFIEGFEQGLLGKQAGDQTDVNVEFPEDYGNEDLSGKPARFDVRVKTVEEAVLPQIDDAFLEAFGVSEGGEEALRTEVRNNMEREREQALRARLKENLMTALTDAVELEIPKALVTHEGMRMAQEMQQRLGQQGMNAEQLASIAPEHFSEQAERRVKLGLIMAEIVQANSLSADPSTVRERVEAMAASYEDPAAVVNYYYEDRSRLAELESAILEDAACDWLLEKAQVTEQNLSFDALMNSGQTG